MHATILFHKETDSSGESEAIVDVSLGVGECVAADPEAGGVEGVWGIALKGSPAPDTDITFPYN